MPESTAPTPPSQEVANRLNIASYDFNDDTPMNKLFVDPNASVLDDGVVRISLDSTFNSILNIQKAADEGKLSDLPDSDLEKIVAGSHVVAGEGELGLVEVGEFDKLLRRAVGSIALSKYKLKLLELAKPKHDEVALEVLGDNNSQSEPDSTPDEEPLVSSENDTGSNPNPWPGVKVAASGVDEEPKVKGRSWPGLKLADGSTVVGTDEEVQSEADDVQGEVSKIANTENVTEVTSDEAELGDTSVEIEDVETREASLKRLMEEIGNTWKGISPEESPQDALRKMNDVISQLGVVNGALLEASFRERTAELSSLINMAMGGGDLSVQKVAEKGRKLGEDLKYAEHMLGQYANGQVTSGNSSLRTEVPDDMQVLIKKLNDMGGERFSLGDIDTSDFGKVYGLLMKVNNLPRKLQQEINVVQEQVDNLSKLANVQHVEEVTSENTDKPKFRNEQIAELAEKVKEQGVESNDDMERVEIALQRYLDDLFEDQGEDAKKLIEQVGGRIDLDGKKARKKPSSRIGQNPTSREYVSELAVDMLSGRFDSESNTGEPIVMENGVVELGQHRAAALMLLHGNNWQKEAARYGIKIETS